ncbi:tyrosine-protein phosphatase [Streptomyces sp. SP18ES09]|uniref:tyrosine-protein phosphatase n=1 Tax=Streptomyces sp. SP18ES09 TaxID=3002532 RepID=UPI002E771548|nr:tyrosine-protein phosphatase [Streptomyces sp. SP18ES09]MEE1815913.1 tyrosine-protein phosphatase [Streptomyces sp. SP18ES09]
MNKATLSATALVSALTLGLPLAPTALASPSERGPSRTHEPHRSGHSIPFTEATVTAGSDGSYTLSWKAEGVRRVEIRAHGRVVARGGATGRAVVTGLPAADRQWFRFAADRGRGLELADRLVRLSGTVNLRDAGGYRTEDGRWVRMGEVYRSDALDRLTPEDRAKLRRLGVRTVFDLRMEDERAKAPDRVPAGADYVVADVFAGSGAFQQLPRTPAEAERMMVDAEKSMVSGEGGKKAYRQVLDGIAEDDARSVLFHCTAGKDRTGWAGAALLTALGVPRETVMADYLASNTYRKAANDAVLGQLPPAQAAVYKPLLDVRPEYLNSGYDEVGTAYGSFDRYLKDALGIDHRELKRLREELLVG